MMVYAALTSPLQNILMLRIKNCIASGSGPARNPPSTSRTMSELDSELENRLITSSVRAASFCPFLNLPSGDSPILPHGTLRGHGRWRHGPCKTWCACRNHAGLVPALLAGRRPAQSPFGPPNHIKVRDFNFGVDSSENKRVGLGPASSYIFPPQQRGIRSPLSLGHLKL